MKILIKVMVLLLAIWSCITGAQSTQEQIQLTHPEISTPLVFNVQLPQGYAAKTEKRYVLMFNFHPYSNTYLSGMHDWMSHNGEWPWLETIIVTPQTGNQSAQLFDRSGVTTPLLDFFEDVLLPAIDKRYRTNGFRIISGFRVDGSIVLSALLHKPSMFNAYFAISPELKNDMAGVMSSLSKRLEGLDTTPRLLIVSHGGSVKERHQVDEYDSLAHQLANHAPRSLEWHVKDYSEHYFMSLPLVTVIAGIETLFDDIHSGLPADSAISQAGPESIVRHYQYLSEQKYGFEVSPKRSLTNLGNSQLDHSLRDGLAVFNVIAKRYPDDAYSYHNIAKAYARYGHYEQAITFQQQAVDLTSSITNWHSKRHRAFLNDYKSAQADATNLHH